MEFTHLHPLHASVLQALPCQGTAAMRDLWPSAGIRPTRILPVARDMLGHGLIDIDERSTLPGSSDLHFSITPHGSILKREMSSVEFQCSKPIEDECIDLYSQGSCHVFARAVCELFDVKRFRLFEDQLDVAFDDGQNSPVLSCVHVYAVVEVDGSDMAVDVFGVRPLRYAEQECVGRFAPGLLTFRDFWSIGQLEEEFRVEGGRPDEIARSLHPVDADMVDFAKPYALQALGVLDVPGKFPELEPFL